MVVRARSTLVGLVVMLVGGTFGLSAQAPRDGTVRPPAALTIARTSGTIVVDGVLDDAGWNDARPFDLPYEVEPGENVPPSVRTEVMLVHTATHLYAAFRCWDPRPGEIRANYSDRDQIETQDRVALQLDTFHDKRRAFLFGSNPFGIQWDAIHVGSIFDNSWDAIWDSAGRRHDWGYVVEMAIPFDQLRFPKSDGPITWGVDASRVLPRSVIHTIGSFARDRHNNCYQCQMIPVTGLEGARPGRSLEIVPTLTAVRSDTRSAMPHGPFVRTHQSADVGASVKWGLTPNLTLQGTVNPDFSQVEADALQLDINQPFALFYQEKRPFFTEGADYFDPLVNRRIEDPLMPVSTRVIRDPQWGGKLTGISGAHVLGGFAVRDTITNIVLPGLERSSTVSLPTANYASVFRYRRDFGSNYSVGTTATSREGGDYFNRLIGIDGDFRLTDHDRVVVNVLGSSTRYPSDVAAQASQPVGGFTDRLLMMHYRHSTRNYYAYGDYQDVGTGFRADLGYVPRVGFTKGEVGGGYTWWGAQGAWLTRVNLSANVDQTRQQNGLLVERELELMASASGPWQSYAGGYYGRRARVYEGVRFRQDFKGGYVGVRPSNRVSAASSIAFEDKIDYQHGRPASEFMATESLEIQATSHLRWTLRYTYLTLDVDEGRLFRVHAADAGVTYQVNRRAFARAILQFTDTSRSPDLYLVPVEPLERTLFLQLLWSYKINPRTVMFVGYSGDLVGQRTFGLTTANRTAFMKVGYALTR